jgi:hypothetical protein
MTLFATRFASDGGTRLDGAVEMIHGSGGRATTELVRTLFHSILTTPISHKATIRPPSTWKPHGWS